MAFQGKDTIDAIMQGMVLGHQMGQWSERAWWEFSVGSEKNHRGMAFESAWLENQDRLNLLIKDPPANTSPGYVPTLFVDTVPHVLMLGKELASAGHMLTPEEFAAFLIREKKQIRLQGSARSCLELMEEGMNPRITGLYAAPIISGCWMVWPVALYNAGFPADAYEDAVRLCRTQTGGDVVEMTGALAAALSAAFCPGMDWQGAKAAMFDKLSKRNPKVMGLLNEAIDMGKTAENPDDLVAALHGDYAWRIQLFGWGMDGYLSFYGAMAALEYAFTNDMDWKAFVRLVLMTSDMRFGAMIAFSLRAAFVGASWPAGWQDQLAMVHSQSVQDTVASITDLLSLKLRNRAAIAREMLPMACGGEESPIFDRMLAAMLSGAAGNAMGSPVEDRDYPWIVEKYGVVNTIMDPSRMESEDDAAMLVMWAETCLRCGDRFYPEDLADTFRKQMNPMHFYYDTQQSYHIMMQGVPAHACGHWNVVTGSGLMGCNPCGMVNAGNPAMAAMDALELAYVYQRGFDVIAPSILCAATAEALRPGATVDNVLEAALKAAPDYPMCHFDHVGPRYARPYFREVLKAVEGCTDVLAARPILYERFMEYNGQDAWEVIALTLAMFKVANGDIVQSMIGGTNIGRDSDTISAQAAILSACMCGMKGVPQWVIDVFPPERIKHYRELAAGMADIVHRRYTADLKAAEQFDIA